MKHACNGGGGNGRAIRTNESEAQSSVSAFMNPGDLLCLVRVHLLVVAVKIARRGGSVCKVWNRDIQFDPVGGAGARRDLPRSRRGLRNRLPDLLKFGGEPH